MPGFFGFFDYTKEGKGVDKDAPDKRRFIVFFDIFGRKLTRLIRVNLLYFVSLIPAFIVYFVLAGTISGNIVDDSMRAALYDYGRLNYAESIGEAITKAEAEFRAVSERGRIRASELTREREELDASSANYSERFAALSTDILSAQSDSAIAEAAAAKRVSELGRRMDLYGLGTAAANDELTALANTEARKHENGIDQDYPILTTAPPDSDAVSVQTDLMIRLFVTILLICLWGAGPVTAGFSYIMRNYVREEHAWVWSDFFGQFRANFKQGIAVFFLDVALFTLMSVSFFFYGSETSPVGWLSFLLQYLIVLMFVLYTFMHFYIYPMMVTFKLNLKELLRNAMLFAMGKLFRNIWISLLVIVPLFAMVLLGMNILLLILLVMLILLSFFGLAMNFCVYPVMKKHMILDENSEIK